MMWQQMDKYLYVVPYVLLALSLTVLCFIHRAPDMLIVHPWKYICETQL